MTDRAAERRNVGPSGRGEGDQLQAGNLVSITFVFSALRFVFRGVASENWLNWWSALL